MRGVLPLVGVALVLGGCRSSGLTQNDGELRLESSSLDFGRVFVGRQVVRSTQLINTSKGARTASLDSRPSVFSVANELVVPGGDQRAVEITFTPLEAGPQTGVIEVHDGPRVLTLEVTGEAREKPTCPTSTITCRGLFPDDEGACIDTPLPDGTACATACIEGGLCQSGVCVGAARSCDDADACTADRCSNEKGCLHEPVSCPSTDACHAPSCDPRSGCGTTEVKDGTRCGVNDCATAHVCISGVCRQVNAPDGSECAPATVCQGPSVCRNGACERPPRTPLTPVWQLHAATTDQLNFPGVADRAGNVYWLTNRTTSTLVSVDRDGHQRFRVPLPGLVLQTSSFAGPESTPLFLISDELFSVTMATNASGIDGSRLEVRSTRTGALVWAKERSDFDALLQLEPTTRFWIMSSGTVGVPSRLWLELRTNAGGSAWRSWIIGLDPATGALLWRVPGTYFDQVLGDDTGLYVHESLFSQSIWSIDANGQLRWSHAPAGSMVLSSTTGGSLLSVYPAQLRATATGMGTAVDAGISPWTLLSQDHIVTVDSNSFCRRWVAVVDTRTHVLNVPVESPQLRCLSEPLLTSRQSVLIGLGSPAEVIEAGLDGSSFFQCPLRDGAVGSTVLVGNRWIVSDGQGRVHAYDLPVPGLATRGWISFHGSMARARRPEQ